jgi:hypothetical protein
MSAFRFLRFCAIGIASICFRESAFATEIYSVTGPNSGISYSVDAIDYVAISWTQTSTYTNVSISAGLAGSGSGDAFLMTSIGLGTTTASQIATSPIVFPGSPTVVGIFSGLTLSPGTYYLLFSGAVTNQPSGWEVTFSPTIVLDSGVTRAVGTYFTDLPPVPYPPNSTYTYFPHDDAGYSLIDVSGTLLPIPEPGTWPIVGAALTSLMWCRSKKRISGEVNLLTKSIKARVTRGSARTF